MRQLLGAAVLAGVLALSGRAGAQESHKFDAKKLAAKYDVPVYPPKGGVVGGEAVESDDETNHVKTAIWSVKGDLKKVLDFYKKALGDPKTESTDDGTEKYVFKKSEPGGSTVRHRVYVAWDKSTKQAEITVWVRTYLSPDDADN